MKKLFFLISLLILTGCTYKTATVKYSDYNVYSQNLGGNKEYEEIGPVKVCVSGFIWTDCAQLVDKALVALNEKAKVLGGDGVIKVSWYTDDGKVLTPTCEEQWGWFALYILPGLGPWTKKACVEGVAVKFVDKK